MIRITASIEYFHILSWPTKVVTGDDSFFTSIDLWVNSHAGLTSHYRQVVIETAIHHRESRKSSIISEDDQNIPTNSPTDEFDCSVCLQEDFSESLELKRPQISGQELCCHGKRWCTHRKSLENKCRTWMNMIFDITHHHTMSPMPFYGDIYWYSVSCTLCLWESLKKVVII